MILVKNRKNYKLIFIILFYCTYHSEILHDFSFLYIMNADIIYIVEKELGKNLKSSLKSNISDENALYILVQLSKNKQEFVPLINNIQEIRLNKLKKKIIEELKINESKHNNIHFVFLDKPFSKRVFNKNFKDVKSISLFATENGMEHVKSIFESQIGINNLQLNYLQLK